MPAKRLRLAVRDQMQVRFESLDQLLPPEHPVRAIWDYLARLDLAAFLAPIRVTDHAPGAPAIDPRVLLTLWVQATLNGVGSRREPSRLCEHHLVYRWVCGDDPVSYRTLSNFRVGSGEALDRLLTESAAVPCEAGLASLDRVAQDGVRVRASAGAGSFRREKTLREHLAEAEEQVKRLKAQVDEDGGAGRRRAQAAKERGARERVGRLEQARKESAVMREAQAERPGERGAESRAKPPAEMRASETDPEARKTKMAGGGFRPAFNVRFATTTAGGVIAGVAVTNEGTDMGQLEPMVGQLKTRYGSRPAEVLVDNGFVGLAGIEAVAGSGVAVFAAVKDAATAVAAGRDPYAKKPGDGPGVAGWRARMGTDAGRAIYKERGQTAEWPNALARNRGLQQFSVRGLTKTKAVATWFAVAHNARRAMALGWVTPPGSAAR